MTVSEQLTKITTSPLGSSGTYTPVGLTQRLLPADRNGEQRQALDVRWESFLAACGLLPVPLPLRTDLAEATMKEARCTGLVLTGGDDLADLGGATPARDRLERHLLHSALAARQPVIGVCRGMQLILRDFGAHLAPVQGHVATEHPIAGKEGSRRVNSFHRWAAHSVSGDLETTASSGDVVEAVRHRSLPLVGMMWHPERTEPPDSLDVDLFTRMFRTGGGAA